MDTLHHPIQRIEGAEHRAGIHNLTSNEDYEGRRAPSQNQWELRDHINDTEGSGGTLGLHYLTGGRGRATLTDMEVWGIRGRYLD